MILQALVHCYEALAERGELEKPGWSPVKVSWGLELDADGQEKEKVRKAEKGMDFNNHCIADDSDQYWRTGDQFCDDRDKK